MNVKLTDKAPELYCNNAQCKTGLGLPLKPGSEVANT